MYTVTIMHINPAGSGEWAIKINEAGASSVQPSEGLAIARAWELVKELPEDEAEVLVLVHEPDGRIRSSLTIRRFRPQFDRLPTGLDLDESLEDAALRARAESITPRRTQLDAMIARGSASTIDYSQEDDELPC